MTTFQRWSYRLLVTLGVLTMIVFYVWWLQPDHVSQNFGGIWHVFDFAIFIVLTGVISHRVFMDLYTWYVMRKIQPIVASPVPQPGLRVAFITTFVPGSEGLELLAKTLPAMIAADYPHDTWLLDEGDDSAARALCDALGVKHFSRKQSREYNMVAGPFTRKTKAGNHNAWYDVHGDGYDIVAQIDTDFLARPDFLTETLGHFADPTVAWVGTPQIYGNTRSFIARGAAQQQYSFYGPVLRGLSGFGNTNMIGANHVVRVAALKEIGYYAGHLTEDLLTGMRLHARGWRSAYVAKPLAVGEGPETWQGYFNQQMRWAYGCIDILRGHTNKLVSRMPRQWGMLYVSLQQGYFSGLAGFTGVVLLAAYFFGGIEISRVPLLGLILWGVPFYFMRGAIGFWSQQFYVRPRAERGIHFAGRMMTLAVWPIYLVALIGVLRQKPLTFKVTPKGGGSQVSASPMVLFRPHLVLAMVSAACVAAAFFKTDPSLVLLAWAILNAVLLGSFVLLAFIGTVAARRPVHESVDELSETMVGSFVVAAEEARELPGLTEIDPVVATIPAHALPVTA